MDILLKRIVTTEGSKGDGGGGGGGGDEIAPEMGSEEMEVNLQRILEKIDCFTQQVGELLETWRTLFKNQFSEFEERLILIHKEKIERWQDAIKELQLRDTVNERARALLGNAERLLFGVLQDYRSRSDTSSRSWRDMDILLKRIIRVEGNEGDGGGGGGDEMAPEMGSEEMELNLQRILEKIDRFTQQVGQLLETGKTLFKNQLSEFEERLILIHKEQIERWQDEIKELQLCDAANERARATNERARALLGNAQHLLSGARQDSVIHNVHEGF